MPSFLLELRVDRTSQTIMYAWEEWKREEEWKSGEEDLEQQIELVQELPRGKEGGVEGIIKY